MPSLATLAVVLTTATAAPLTNEPAPSIRTFPAAITLQGPKSTHGVLVQSPDGHDLTWQAKYESSDPHVVAVSTNGMVTAVADGQTEVLIRAGGQVLKLPVSVTSSATFQEPSFRQEVEPALTRLGCNQGGCHGKLAGQNGFKLSLRGYAPELDYSWIAQDVSGRRINPAAPAESLLISKPAGRVPHEGLVRFAEGSRYESVLTDWVRAQAPGPKPESEEPNASRMEVLPGDRTYIVGETQQLLVEARWPDGSEKDVTWLTQFFSNDETIAAVTPDGLVKAVRAGETSIRAHFQGQVQVVRVAVPYTYAVDGWRYSRKNNAVDDAVFAKLAALHLPVSSRCDDLTFMRRVMLDMIGTLPTPEEVQSFAADRSPEKRQKLVDALLERPEFADYWTLMLADLLQNRKERDHDVRGTKGVRAFHAWLHNQVAANRSWAEIARSVLTASGDAVSNPAIGYFVTLYGEKPPAESEVTDAVSQAFLGARVGCARCHNHPLERYTQDDFYHFAAFFGKTSLDRKDLAGAPTRLELLSREERERRKGFSEAESKYKEAEQKLVFADEKAAPDARKEFANRQREYAERKRELREEHDRQPVAWQPRTHRDIVAQPLDRSKLEFAPGQDARVVLADWITSPTNSYFSGAMVNRLWHHFFSVGLVEPVDDLRASNPPSNAELWKLLNTEFVAEGFQIKPMIRLIVNSRTYQLSSSTLKGNETEHRFYSHYYPRRLPAEVLEDALSAATGVPEKYDLHPVGLRAIQLPEPHVGNYFLSLFGRSDRVTACACERNGEVTLPQLLHLQNGDDLGAKLRDVNGRLQALLKSDAGRERLVEMLYLSSLSRPPTPAELARVKSSLDSGKPEETMPDLFWALLNTKEFAFNH